MFECTTYKFVLKFFNTTHLTAGSSVVLDVVVEDDVEDEYLQYK